MRVWYTLGRCAQLRRRQRRVTLTCGPGAGSLKLHGRPAWRIHFMGMLTWLAINAGLWFCFAWWLVGRTRLVWIIGAASYAGVVLFHGVISSRRGYAVSSWHEMADSCERTAQRRHCPSFVFRGIGWVFRQVRFPRYYYFFFLVAVCHESSVRQLLFSMGAGVTGSASVSSRSGARQ